MKHFIFNHKEDLQAAAVGLIVFILLLIAISNETIRNQMKEFIHMYPFLNMYDPNCPMCI